MSMIQFPSIDDSVDEITEEMMDYARSVDDDAQAIKILTQLTDKLRRNGKYNGKYKRMIFAEVDKRIAKSI